MSKFIYIFNELVIKSIKNVQSFFIEYSPNIILAIIILFIGWISAFLFKKIISKLSKALGINVISDKTGFKKFLDNGGIKKELSYFTGLFFYWIILFSTLIMVFNTLELKAASNFINQAIYYIPKIVISILMLSLGMFISNFFKTFVTTSARLANIKYSKLLGTLTQYSIIIISIILSLEYIGIKITIFIEYLIFIIAFLLIILLIFIYGGREIFLDLISTHFLMKELKLGNIIEYNSITGKIIEINLRQTVLEIADNKKLSIPNHKLIQESININSQLKT